jgi:hypothetical protein
MKRAVKPLLLRLALAALLCGAATAAQAHRFHAGIADISFNQASGSVEVVHTYMAHDIEALLSGLAGRPVDLTRPEDEALLRKYLEQRFYLLGADGARLPLKWVGMTANVESVVLYQELEGTTLAQVARVHDAVLSDLLPRQANTVNVRAGGQVRSLAFDAKTVERRIR